MVNFEIYYDVDGDLSRHVLETDKYQPGGPADSWVLLEEPAPEAQTVRAAPPAPAPPAPAAVSAPLGLAAPVAALPARLPPVAAPAPLGLLPQSEVSSAPGLTAAIGTAAFAAASCPAAVDSAAFAASFGAPGLTARLTAYAQPAQPRAMPPLPLLSCTPMAQATQATQAAQAAQAAQAVALGAQHALPTQTGPPFFAAAAPPGTEAANAGAAAPHTVSPPTLPPPPAEPGPSGRTVRRPSGRAPAGKVWNALLGQWDSADGGLGAPAPLAPRGAPRAAQVQPAAASTSAPAAPPPRGTLRMVLGDCVEGMRQLPSGSVDLVIADPPYNIGVQVS